VVGPGGWNVVKQIFGQAAVGVDQAHTMPQGDMLDDQASQESRFAGAGLSDPSGALDGLAGWCL